MQHSSQHRKGHTSAMRSFVVGGLLPVIAFSVIEDQFGVIWGLVAGMAFGVGEVIWERYRHGRVSGITLGGNALLVVLGVVSLVTQEGIWFKLQPSLIEGGFAVALIVSVILRRPLLYILASKQALFSPHMPLPVKHAIQRAMSLSTVRFGLFFGAHAALAAWAAFHWSTAVWAMIKGIGGTLGLVAYSIFEGFLIRRAVQRGATL